MYFEVGGVEESVLGGEADGVAEEAVAIQQVVVLVKVGEKL